MFPCVGKGGGARGWDFHLGAARAGIWEAAGGAVPSAVAGLGVAISTTALLAGKFYYVHKGDLWSMYFLAIYLGILLSRVIQ